MLTFQHRPRTAREWQSTLGVDNQCFIRLSEQFGVTYEAKRGQSINQTLSENPNGQYFKIRAYDDFVFFILFVLKTGLTFDQTAFIFQIDLAGAKRYFDKGLDILYYTLLTNEFLPIREFDSPKDMEVYFDNTRQIIIDGTEQRIQRPESKEKQLATYSGKKKQNTYKCLIISTMDTYVHYISKIYSGKQHDFSIIKQEFNPEEDWFSEFEVRLDLGYLGFDKEYPKSIPYLPSKNYKKKPLTEQQKETNRQLASQRIKVEHSIAGIKRYEMVSAQSRLKDENLYDKIVAVTAGLWNFYITR